MTLPDAAEAALAEVLGRCDPDIVGVVLRDDLEVLGRTIDGWGADLELLRARDERP